MRNIITILSILFLSTCLQAAEFHPTKLSQLTDDLGVETHTADTSNPHGTSTTQTNLTVTNLTITDTINLGTATTPGLVKQTNGTASGTVLTSVSIESGTGTLSNANLPGTVTLSTLYGTSSIEINAVSQLQFKINGNAMGLFNSTGLSVGGSFAPSYPLDVLGTAALTGNLLQSTANSYHWFGGTLYGLRDNAGTMEFKNTGGTWTAIPVGTATAGGWTDNGATVVLSTPTDNLVIGSTTSSGRQLTCVGSSTFYGQIAIGSNTTLLGGLSTLLDLAIGDNDTGFKWTQDGDLDFYGNGDIQIKIDGNNDKILMGTTTSGSKLNVGGTVTAEGFSGKGNELTGVPAGSINLPTGTSTIGNLVTNVVTGSSSAYCYVYNTVGSPTVSSGTWTNIAMNADTNNSYNATHSATNNSQIKALVSGIYEISGKILTTCDANSVEIRLCKNNESEIPGSFSTEYRNFANGVSSYPVSTGIVQTRLAVNDYVYMQVAGSGNVELDYYLNTMQNPGTSSYATLSLRKIGD